MVARMADIKLKKRYKYAGDVFKKLIDIGFDGKGQLTFSGDFQPLYLPGETCNCYFTE